MYTTNDEVLLDEQFWDLFGADCEPLKRTFEQPLAIKLTQFKNEPKFKLSRRCLKQINHATMIKPQLFFLGSFTPKSDSKSRQWKRASGKVDHHRTHARGSD